MATLPTKPAFSRKKRKTSRGQSLVELAIVLALLMFMVVAIAEYGFLLNQYLNILDAGREATRQSSLGDPFNANGSVNEEFYEDIALQVNDYLLPLEFDPDLDDLVISFFSVSNGNAVRFPGEDGWSRYGHRVSQFSSDDIEARLNAGAPPTGVLLVEIFFNYWQTMNLPIFSNVIPNPIPLYNYSIMPLSAAEPTPIP